MQKPLISIVVPCYNQAKFLDECLQSVLEQTYENWECIIVNDGSPDKTLEVVKKWIIKDERFKYIEKENGGVASARNFGIEKALGKYVQFLDGDDILQKEKLNYQLLILEENKNIGIVYGSSRYFFDGYDDNLYAIHPAGIIPSIDLKYNDKNQLDVILKKNISTMCGTLYRKEIFETIRFKNSVYEDYLLHLEIAADGNVFHYESFQDGDCLIRITSDSQMMRHNTDTEKNKLFFGIVEKIKLDNPSKFIDFQNPAKNLISSATKNKSSINTILKEVVYNICPPIVFKIFNVAMKSIK